MFFFMKSKSWLRSLFVFKQNWLAAAAEACLLLVFRQQVQTVVVGGPDLLSSSTGAALALCNPFLHSSEALKQWELTSPCQSSMVGNLFSGDRTQQMKIRVTTGGQAENRTKREHQRGVKRAAIMEGVCFVDASKEGNVSRFINVSPET